MTSFHRHNNKAAKLSVDNVLAIRADYEAGLSQGDLSRKYDMSVGQIGRIVRRESWRHLPGELSEGEMSAAVAALQEAAAEARARSGEGMLEELAAEPPGLPEIELSEETRRKAEGFLKD